MSGASSELGRWSWRRIQRTIVGPIGARKADLRHDLGRLAQVILGLVSLGFAVVVLASPEVSLTGLLLLLGAAVGLVAAQNVLAGGRLLSMRDLGLRVPGFDWQTLRSWGMLGVGLLALAMASFAVLDPALALKAAVFLLALALVAQGFGRIFEAGGVALPLWRRGSTFATGVTIVGLVVLSIAFAGWALPGFAILVGLVLLISGIDTIVAGLHPTDARQFVLLKLILFAALYGLVLINWIDLYGKAVPAYGLWLILTYMAPFGVVMVFEGWESWPLATSLGLLVSLMNDVGYYFVGNLLFGFHQNLGPWIAGQLGFQGSQLVTIFEGGSFTLDVTSWMMGLSIYARAAVVGVILYYWWRHPSGIVARTAADVPPATGPGPGPARGAAGESRATAGRDAPGER
ncbi:MAG: hypothetical protein ABSB97_04075 [Thermoplasmata archaeon]|jgi:uncharacterized membrane protein HdeD (DUF308 family)